MNLHPPNGHPALLGFVTDPNHAVLLLLAGILLIYAEFNRPGMVLPGCAGMVSGTFSVYGLLHLAIAPGALLTIFLSLALIAAGIRFRLREALTAAGCAGLTFGLWRLTPGVLPEIACAASILFTVVTTWLLRIALRARRNKQIHAGVFYKVHTREFRVSAPYPQPRGVQQAAEIPASRQLTA